jgi:hypothetical protein
MDPIHVVLSNNPDAIEPNISEPVISPPSSSRINIRRSVVELSKKLLEKENVIGQLSKEFTETMEDLQTVSQRLEMTREHWTLITASGSTAAFNPDAFDSYINHLNLENAKVVARSESIESQTTTLQKLIVSFLETREYMNIRLEIARSNLLRQYMHPSGDLMLYSRIRFFLPATLRESAGVGTSRTRRVGSSQSPYRSYPFRTLNKRANSN